MPTSKPTSVRPKVDATAAAGVTGPLDGAVMCAGLVGLTDRPGSLLASVNYFGAVELVEALRPQLADPSSVVLLSSNSVTIQPGWDQALVDACLDGDEALARSFADQRDSPTAYPATKAALARWVRRNAPAWAADGIRAQRGRTRHGRDPAVAAGARRPQPG